jgi:hypothetical protein
LKLNPAATMTTIFDLAPAAFIPGSENLHSGPYSDLANHIYAAPQNAYTLTLLES